MNQRTKAPGAPLLGYTAKRLLAAIPLVAGLVIVTFVLMRVLPGDPAREILGSSARPSDLAAIRHRLGTDQSVGHQFQSYVAGLAHLDLGRSLYSSKGVSRILSEKIGPTARLAGSSLVLALALALPIGLGTARLSGRPLGAALTAGTSLAWLLPGFWIGPVLMKVFAVDLGILPVSGPGGFSHLVLPAATLGVPAAAYFGRLLGANLRDQGSSELARSLRLRGIPEGRLLARHALPNAVAPLTAVLAVQAGAFFTGAIVTETVFAWPGLGRLLVESIFRRDYPVVQGCVLLFGLVYAAASLAGDLLHAAIDPRVREELR